MSITPELYKLGQYLTGVFENRQQALESPAWYVHLRLWYRPVAHFWPEDSIALFAEQANVYRLDAPYRPRLLRLRGSSAGLQVEYYKFQQPDAIRGAGQNPQRLETLPLEAVEFLPGCTLTVQVQPWGEGDYHFQTEVAEHPCCFSYQEKKYYIALGFAVNPQRLEVYDKGIDPDTGRGTWGALMGPFRFVKCPESN